MAGNSAEHVVKNDLSTTTTLHPQARLHQDSGFTELGPTEELCTYDAIIVAYV